MKKNKKIIIISSCILILIAIIISLILIKNNQKQEQENINKKEKIDQIETYDYYLEDNSTEYYKKLYNELKNILKEEKIDEEEYAKIISKLFVTDLFTLNNKMTSSDIGGLQFIHNNFKNDFINIAKTTLYSNIENNIYKDRKQELPIVRKTDVINIKESKFSYKNKKYDSYEIDLSIEYEKDLGYPVEYKVILIKNDKHLQVVKGE